MKRLTLLCFTLLGVVPAGAQEALPSPGVEGLPLVFYDDFESGMDAWEPLDPAAWEVVDEGGNHVLSVNGQSRYEPPVRSPVNLAFVKDLWVSGFVLQARLKSTAHAYGHRDMCIAYQWQDPAHFYYTHLATAADPHAHSIFLVDGADRVSIARERTEGVAWRDDHYHTVRIVRDARRGTVEVFFDDLTAPIMSAQDTTFRFGRVGLGAFDDPGRLDDVRVWGRRVAPPNLTDEQLLELYDGLRVADVSDGMDAVGLRDAGLMDTRIEALWRDLDGFAHQFAGIAVTVRYVPTNDPVPNPIPPGAFDRWVGRWYNEVSSEPFVEHLRPGSVVVIDAAGDGDTGSVGSFNSLFWVSRGARGIVTTGSVRDTDEIIKQRIPLYMDPEQRGRGIRPGRNEVESVNRPVQVGGVLVEPGDVVVADGDGVVVVPRAYAVPVARAARTVLDQDKAGRRNLYQELGRPLDRTVEQ